MTALLRAHRLSLPPDLALLIKAFVSAEGMGTGLCPGFQMTSEALPLLKRVLQTRHQPKAMAARGWRSLIRWTDLLAGLPDDLARLLGHVRHAGFQVHIDVEGLQRTGDQLDRAASRLTVGVVVAALIIGSSIVMTVRGGPEIWGLPAFGFLGFVGACVGAVWLLRSIARGGREAAKRGEDQDPG